MSHPLCDPSLKDEGLIADPVFTRSVYDLDIDDIVGKIGEPVAHFQVKVHYCIDNPTRNKKGVILLDKSLSNDGFLRVSALHSVEGIIAFGRIGQELHLVHLTD